MSAYGTGYVAHGIRIQWLMDHPQTWQGYTITKDSEAKRILFEMMQSCGLYSRTTTWYDARLHHLVRVAAHNLKSQERARIEDRRWLAKLRRREARRHLLTNHC